MSLTNQMNELSKRLTALEGKDLNEETAVPLISKIYKDVYCPAPFHCSEETYCSEETVVRDDPNGNVVELGTQLTHIGIGTGAVPALGDTLLQNEQVRKQVMNPIMLDNVLIAETYLDELEGNGTTFTNAGIFGQEATDVINTGVLFIGGAINQSKDSTKTLTIGIEIQALEVE